MRARIHVMLRGMGKRWLMRARAPHSPGTCSRRLMTWLDRGCVLYLINQEKGNPDTVWVTEVWRSQADLDASLAHILGASRSPWR
jgi:hypothetical protein